MILALNSATIGAAVVVVLIVVLLLVMLLLWAKAKLTTSGPVKLTINGEKEIEVSAGNTLLSTLSDQKIFLPSACGGGGTCAMCKCQVKSGGGEILPTEKPYFSRKEIQEDWRLGCQVKVKQDMDIQIPDEIFGIKKWECEVVSNYNVATFIKEFVVRLPEGETLDFEAGGYIQVDVPAITCDFKDIDIAPHPDDPAGPDKFKEDWDKFNLWPLTMKNPEPVFRAYSMANHPAEGNIIMLNIRIATPPWDREKNTWMNVNPGICSSYVFTRKPGDKVTISGPYGEFFINESDAEMLYVGGGAGMAPMRSHLYHLFRTLQTGRKITFWYGGRSRKELFYLDHFYKLEKDFSNFKFYVALSDPLPEDNWKVKEDLDSDGDGFLGFIHNCVIDNYLKFHESPEDIELYFCGPPLMNQAVQKMGEDFGIPDENIRFDDFGG